MAIILILAVAAFFFGMGVVTLAQPEAVLASFGTQSLTRDGRNEVRAVYGGFGVAIAALLIAVLFLSSLRSGVLITIAVALYVMAAGRLVSILLEGVPGFYPWLFLGVEVGLASALLAASHLG
ncbi:MAG: DUF4345 family protein [Candidatus Binatia bacterium]